MRDYASVLPVALDLDLSNAGWDGALLPYPGQPLKQFAMSALRRSLLKKYSEGDSKEANRRALDLFLKINSSCACWSLDYSSITEIEAIALGEAKDFIYRFAYGPEDCDGDIAVTFNKIASALNLGNGANIGSWGTDFLSKVGTSTMSATSTKLHDLFVQAIRVDRVWPDVEYIRSVNRGYQVVKGSRLSFVPKTTEISRTICTEPVCNMLLQKGIAHALEGRLQQVNGIDLRIQPDKNRTLALLGSKSGRFGTIDLSSASDSMSLRLVREFFPEHLTRWFEMTRSPITVLPDGTEVELHMVSSMGNAFTFPLQTIFFSALVHGVYRALGIKIENPWRRSLGNFAVFGDDIIVVREAYDLTCRLLMLCGFSVNVDKSFNEGFFRESCGRDYYSGRNVRGVYIKTLADKHDQYSAINRLNVWSAIWSIPLPNTIQYLRKGLRNLYVPFAEMDIAGIKVPESLLQRKRFNRNRSIVYRYYDLDHREVDVSDVECRPPKLRGWINNPSAVLLAALAGTVRSGRVVPRVNRRSSRVKQKCSPCWDYIPADQMVTSDFGSRWKTAVEVNLNFS